MYYIKNGLKKHWHWLAYLFSDAGENAPWNIDLNTAGTLLILTSTTPMARIIYNTAINGMSFSVTLPIQPL